MPQQSPQMPSAWGHHAENPGPPIPPCPRHPSPWPLPSLLAYGFQGRCLEILRWELAFCPGRLVRFISLKAHKYLLRAYYMPVHSTGLAQSKPHIDICSQIDKQKAFEMPPPFLPTHTVLTGRDGEEPEIRSRIQPRAGKLPLRPPPSPYRRGRREFLLQEEARQAWPRTTRQCSQRNTEVPLSEVVAHPGLALRTRAPRLEL